MYPEDNGKPVAEMTIAEIRQTLKHRTDWLAELAANKTRPSEGFQRYLAKEIMDLRVELNSRLTSKLPE